MSFSTTSRSHDDDDADNDGTRIKTADCPHSPQD